VIVCGGVMSGIGKGVIAASTGLLLKQLGLNVTCIKIDPYLNVDAGTMSPFEHGEVYVLNDGGEVDLDLGFYERFLDKSFTRDNNLTTGKIYYEIIKKERRGDYLGKTVQVVPHVTDAIQDWIERAAKINVDVSNKGENEICVVELGGTVGDIESMPFVEALRQFQFRVGRENFCVMMVSLVPEAGPDHEQKTKPTQTCVRELRALGLMPDVILLRGQSVLSQTVRKKVGQFCHVEEEGIIGVHDVSNMYSVPLLLEAQGLSSFLVKKMALKVNREPELGIWRKMSISVDQLRLLSAVKIALVGKYVHQTDSYKSIIAALQHAGMFLNCRVEILFIEAEYLGRVESEDVEMRKQNLRARLMLEEADGILVPGGFGIRGIEGKLEACRFARVGGVPYFGICLGMQVAVIETCKNVLGWENVGSEEFGNEEQKNVIINMPEIDKENKGGTMRLGSRTTLIERDTLAYNIYQSERIEERHRHRYEVDPKLVSLIEGGSLMRFTGRDESGSRMEIVEMGTHPFFVGVQFHPEFLSRPTRPSSPFVWFVRAANKKY
jgi:CTP synthase